MPGAGAARAAMRASRSRRAARRGPDRRARFVPRTAQPRAAGGRAGVREMLWRGPLLPRRARPVPWRRFPPTPGSAISLAPCQGLDNLRSPRTSGSPRRPCATRSPRVRQAGGGDARTSVVQARERDSRQASALANRDGGPVRGRRAPRDPPRAIASRRAPRRGKESRIDSGEIPMLQRWTVFIYGIAATPGSSPRPYALGSSSTSRAAPRSCPPVEASPPASPSTSCCSPPSRCSTASWRAGLKAWWTRFVPEAAERSITCSPQRRPDLAVRLWLPLGGVVWSVEGSAALCCTDCSLSAGAGARSTFLINHFDFSGCASVAEPARAAVPAAGLPHAGSLSPRAAPALLGGCSRWATPTRR